MRKIFLALVLLLSATFALHAEEFNGILEISPAETKYFQDSLEISFGEDFFDIYQKMTRRRWKYLRSGNYYGHSYSEYNGKQYEYKDIDKVYFNYYDGLLCAVYVYFKNPSDSVEILSTFIDKYELIDIGDGFYSTADSKFYFYQKDNYLVICDYLKKVCYFSNADKLESELQYYKFL